MSTHQQYSPLINKFETGMSSRAFRQSEAKPQDVSKAKDNFRKYDNHISLTDMRKAKDGDFFNYDWLRNHTTGEFLGIWETVHNPDFNSGDFAIIGSQAGLNNYKLSVKQWVKKTSDIRRALVEADLVDTALRDSAFRQSEAKPQVLSAAKNNLVALPGQLFYSTQPIEGLAA